MSTVVVDSPRAWGTVVGGFIANFILGGLAKSYGIILEYFQDEFEAPTAIFTLTGGVLYMLMFILSLPNHFVVQRIGDRAVVMIGGICACISLFVAGIAPNVTVWAIAVGGGVGFSFSCVYFNIFTVVGRCFRRRLGLANGLSVAGVSVGQMAFPGLTTHLLQTYGVRTGTILMSAFSLHLCVTAVLMPRHVIDPEVDGDIVVSASSSSVTKNLSSVTPVEGVSEDDLKVQEEAQPMLTDVTTTQAYAPYRLDLRREAKVATALLVIYVIGKVFADNGDVGISIVAPPYGSQIGFASQTTNLAIAVAGAVDLFSRLFFGWLTDRPICHGRRGAILAFTWLVEAANAIAFGEIAGVPWSLRALTLGQQTLYGGLPSTGKTVAYYFCFAIHGVCSGTAMTQMIIVLSDWVGPVRLPKSLAIMMVTLGLLYVPAQTLLGFLNDLTNTYAWSMRMSGLWLLLGSLVLFLESPIRRAIAVSDFSTIPPTNSNALLKGEPNPSLSHIEVPDRSPWCQHLPDNVVISAETLSAMSGFVCVPSAPANLTESTIPFIDRSGEAVALRT